MWLVWKLLQTGSIYFEQKPPKLDSVNGEEISKGFSSLATNSLQHKGFIILLQIPKTPFAFQKVQLKCIFFCSVHSATVVLISNMIFSIIGSYIWIFCRRFWEKCKSLHSHCCFNLKTYFFKNSRRYLEFPYRQICSNFRKQQFSPSAKFKGHNYKISAKNHTAIVWFNFQNYFLGNWRRYFGFL